MGLFNAIRRLRENRAGVVEFEDSLLSALLNVGNVSKKMALSVPAISGAVDLIAGLVAETPVKLYRDKDGKAEEITDDPRVGLLNDETGDTLNANQFWRAMIRDYYTGKGGYAYIERKHGRISGVYYVDEAYVSCQRNVDPIHKDCKLLVQGIAYEPYEFIKILRNTKDGVQGVPITQELAPLIETAYESLLFERAQVKKGGMKRGVIISEDKLTESALDTVKNGYRQLYSNDSDRMLVLNKGLKFQEVSNTAVEMQLNESKLTNANDLAKVFHISTDIMAGQSADTSALAKLAVIPLLRLIENELNSVFLLEREKPDLYWAFDTKELLKGDMQSRFNAYKTALDANFMQIDEVRYAEDMEPLGLNWIKLGLNDVLYDPKTKIIYTPNTNQTSRIGENSLQERAADAREDEE